MARRNRRTSPGSMRLLADLDAALRKLERAMLLDADPERVDGYGRRVDELRDAAPFEVWREVGDDPGALTPWYRWRLDERYTGR